jgi:hypothetical protein
MFSRLSQWSSGTLLHPSDAAEPAPTAVWLAVKSLIEQGAVTEHPHFRVEELSDFHREASCWTLALAYKGWFKMDTEPGWFIMLPRVESLRLFRLTTRTDPARVITLASVHYEWQQIPYIMHDIPWPEARFPFTGNGTRTFEVRFDAHSKVVVECLSMGDWASGIQEIPSKALLQFVADASFHRRLLWVVASLIPMVATRIPLAEVDRLRRSPSQVDLAALALFLNTLASKQKVIGRYLETADNFIMSPPFTTELWDAFNNRLLEMRMQFGLFLEDNATVSRVFHRRAELLQLDELGQVQGVQHLQMYNDSIKEGFGGRTLDCLLQDIISEQLLRQMEQAVNGKLIVPVVGDVKQSFIARQLLAAIDNRVSDPLVADRTAQLPAVNDRRPWAVARVYKEMSVMRSVVRLDVHTEDGSEVKFGTGFIVRRHFLMTVQHVLPDASAAQRAEVLFDYCHPGQPSGVRGKLRPDLFYWSNRELDVAIVGVEYPADEYQESQHQPLWGKPLSQPELRQPIPLMPPQFPRARDNQIEVYAYAKSEALQRLSPGRIEKYEPSSSTFSYTCQTCGGASGAPVFDSVFGLLGVHVGGDPATTSPFCERANKDRKFGAPTAAIVKALQDDYEKRSRTAGVSPSTAVRQQLERFRLSLAEQDSDV